MKYTSSYDISIDFLPWFDNGFVLKSLHIYEELGGKIANGKIELELIGTEESLRLVTKQYTGKLIIEKNKGNIYDIDIFITKRHYYKNSLTLEFLCIKDKSFYTDLVSLEYPDITTALNTLYPGKVDIRCESDVNNDIKLVQNTETNQSFCTKLAYSYKKDSIFAFGWDRFLLKDRIGKYDSRGNIEPKLALVGGLGTESMDPYTMKYDHVLFEKPWDPWLDNESKYTDLVPTNSRTIKFYNNYITVGTNYSTLIGNYLYNTKQQSTTMYNTLRAKINDIPDFRLGDVILYKHINELDIPYEAYLVKSNELFLSMSPDKKDSSGSNMFWISKLVALDLEGKLLPEVDILSSLNKDGSIE